MKLVDTWSGNAAVVEKPEPPSFEGIPWLYIVGGGLGLYLSSIILGLGGSSNNGTKEKFKG